MSYIELVLKKYGYKLIFLSSFLAIFGIAMKFKEFLPKS